MSRNPYSHIGTAEPEFFTADDRRTSVLAIVALVLALLCFIPMLGAVALVLGGAAILLISRSRGRLGGLGLAITACVVGMITTLLWLTVIGGAMQISNLTSTHFLRPVATVFEGVQKGDVTAAKAMLSPRVRAEVTDAEVAEFGRALKDEMGTFQGAPEGIVALILAYVEIGESMKNVQGRNNVIPFPGRFSKGLAIVVLHVDQHGGGPINPGGSIETIPLMNYGVVTKEGKEIWLVSQDDLVNRLNKAERGSNTNAKDDSSASDDDSKREPPNDNTPAP